jgi:hypothetical protein
MHAVGVSMGMGEAWAISAVEVTTVGAEECNGWG